ncbi:MAG: class I SAM-dependent methyltransferase [Candidatus Latescibacteria bacterium]|nr:class I SAM-dependent methyltransferase [Candidatus Latescibacterota bacterium]
MDWYKRWFGEEYLLVYEHRNIQEAEYEIQRIKDIIGLRGDEHVLDLCCGPGRHDSAIAELGCSVVGLDYSMPMLKIARESAPYESTYPLYVRGDARHVPFKDEAFDVVLNLFTSFGYFTDEENKELIVTIARVLKPGGRYLIDYLNPKQVIENLVEVSSRNKEGMKITEKRHYDRTTGRIEKTIFLQWDENSQTFHESVRLYEPEEMRAMIRNAGLGNTTMLGSVDGEPYSPTSQRMILHGVK